MAKKTKKTYTVTFSSSENVYDNSQLLTSIFEGIDAVTNSAVQVGSPVPLQPESAESEKEIA